MNIFIFGGTGDLAQRKLLPALYRHFKAERLSPQIKIYGIGSSSLDILSYQQEVKNKLSINLESIEYEESTVQKFIEVISYIKIDFNIDNDFESLKKITSNKDRNLFYLAVTPVFYKVIADNLDKQSVIGPHSSIIVEKPIGNDLKSSIDINESLALYFNENQIFRIDHYLGKEAVQNLLALRF